MPTLLPSDPNLRNNEISSAGLGKAARRLHAQRTPRAATIRLQNPATNSRRCSSISIMHTCVMGKPQALKNSIYQFWSIGAACTKSASQPFPFRSRNSLVPHTPALVCPCRLVLPADQPT